MNKKFWKFYRQVFKLPSMLRVELCSLCNLECSDCYMRKKSSGQIVGNGYLKFEDFKKLLDKNPYIEMIEVSMGGEIFLNPDFIKIIEYAHKKDVKLTAFNGVNFNKVSDEIIEALVKYQFAGITFSIDGTSNETYSIYRKNGNYDNVISNIKKLNEYKKKYNSKYPILRWQFIMFDYTKHQYFEACDIASSLGFADIYYKMPWSKKEYTVEDHKLLTQVYSKRIPVYDSDVFNLLRKNSIPLCLHPWLSPQVNWDGRLLGCCCAVHRDLGVNVFKVGLQRALRAPRMKKMRQILLGKIPSDNYLECHNCDFYKTMKANNDYIKNPSFV